jgi:hypothetical protein
MKSDIVLPLITPGSHDYEDYLRYKITGTYNLAFGFKLPMLMHESFSAHRIFRETSVFYREGGIMESLQKLAGKPSLLGLVRRRINGMEDFDFELQAGRYATFVTQ